MCDKSLFNEIIVLGISQKYKLFDHILLCTYIKIKLLIYKTLLRGFFVSRHINVWHTHQIFVY